MQEMGAEVPPPPLAMDSVVKTESAFRSPSFVTGSGIAPTETMKSPVMSQLGARRRKEVRNPAAGANPRRKREAAVIREADQPADSSATTGIASRNPGGATARRIVLREKTNGDAEAPRKGAQRKDRKEGAPIVTSCATTGNAFPSTTFATGLTTAILQRMNGTAILKAGVTAEKRRFAKPIASVVNASLQHNCAMAFSIVRTLRTRSPVGGQTPASSSATTGNAFNLNGSAMAMKIAIRGRTKRIVAAPPAGEARAVDSPDPASDFVESSPRMDVGVMAVVDRWGIAAPTFVTSVRSTGSAFRRQSTRIAAFRTPLSF